MKNKDCYDIQSICKDLNFVNKICLSNSNSKIKDIIDFSLEVCIVESSIIKICDINKLILKGYKTINIEYLLDNCTGKVIFKKFVIPFFELIPIPYCSDIIDVRTESIYCDIKQCSTNSVWFFNIISINLLIYNKKSTPSIYCDKTLNDCSTNWDFKNDCYPNKKITCCDEKDTFFKEKENCFKKQVYKPNNCKQNDCKINIKTKYKNLE